MGIAEDSLCQICFAAEGTLWHRHLECEATESHRRQVCVKCFEKWTSSVGIVAVERCLLPHPLQGIPPPLRAGGVEWVRPEAFSVLTGRCYSDGSGLYGKYGRDALRAGWAFGKIDQQGRILVGAYGPVTGEQETGVAEMLAAAALLAHARPPIVVVTDYLPLVEGVELGEAICVARRRFAAAWRALWFRINEIGLGDLGVSFQWTRGHQTISRLVYGSDEWLDAKGNHAIDELAKKGARQHPVDEEAFGRCDTLREGMRSLAGWVGEVGVLVDRLGRDVAGPDPDRAASKRDAARDQRRAAAAKKAHDVRIITNSRGKERLVCQLCGMSGAKEAGRQSPLKRTGCPGAPTAISTAHDSHQLWVLRPYVFCGACGAHATGRGVKLKRACKGRPSGDSARHRRDRLVGGRHPITGKDLGDPVRWRGHGASEAVSIFGNQVDLVGQRVEWAREDEEEQCEEAAASVAEARPRWQLRGKRPAEELYVPPRERAAVVAGPLLRWDVVEQQGRDEAAADRSLQLTIETLRGASFEDINPPTRRRGRVDLTGATFVSAGSGFGAGREPNEMSLSQERLRSSVTDRLDDGARGGELMEAVREAQSQSQHVRALQRAGSGSEDDADLEEESSPDGLEPSLEGFRQAVVGILTEGLRGGVLREVVREALGRRQRVAADAGAWSASEEDEALGRAAAPGGGEADASSDEDAAIHQAVEAVVRRSGARTITLGRGSSATPASQPRWLAAWQARRAAREAEDEVHRAMAEVYRAGAQGQFRRWL